MLAAILLILAGSSSLAFVAILLIGLIEEVRRKGKTDLRNSALYVGRVWHTRFLPKKHAFQYPIFIFALDLEETSEFEKSIGWLRSIIKFRESDHLINGEGIDHSATAGNSLLDRVLRLVASRTKNKFAPSVSSHRVVILTHLCYFGYNFNPVSFYYIINRETNAIDTIIGEVSNTPWTEMHCYVLHSASIDDVELVGGIRTNDHRQYSFPKRFHVSPFMEMDYDYNWTFQGIPTIPLSDADMKLMVINQLQRKGTLHFSARLEVQSRTIRPFRLAWQMVRYPVFCMIVQIWIHFQAAGLFTKGIAYVPHPNDAETTASKTIGTLMTPFFFLRDNLSPESKEAEGTGRKVKES